MTAIALHGDRIVLGWICQIQGALAKRKYNPVSIGMAGGVLKHKRLSPYRDLRLLVVVNNIAGVRTIIGQCQNMTGLNAFHRKVNMIVVCPQISWPCVIVCRISG